MSSSFRANTRQIEEINVSRPESASLLVCVVCVGCPIFLVVFTSQFTWFTPLPRLSRNRVSAGLGALTLTLRMRSLLIERQLNVRSAHVGCLGRVVHDQACAECGDRQRSPEQAMAGESQSGSALCIVRDS
jgi:hypothetical protein